MSDITLSSGIRQNLLSLQQTSADLTTTQEALATGKSVNSAADNPSAYFTSQNLTNSANSLSALLDQIGQGSQTINAATDGLTQLTSLLQQALSTVEQAQSSSWTTAASATGTASLGGTAATTSTVNLAGFVGGTTTGTTTAAQTAASTLTLNVGASSYNVALTSGETNAQVASAINGTSGLSGSVTATTDSGGHLVLTALSGTSSFSVAADASVGFTAATTATSSLDATAATTLAAGTLSINVGSASYNVSIAADASLSTIESDINNTTGLSGVVTATDDGSGHLKLTSSSNFTVDAGTTANAVGLTSSSTASSAVTLNGAANTGVAAGNLQIAVGSTTYSVSVASGSTLAQIENDINNTTGLGSTGAVTATDDGNGHLILNSNNAPSSLTVIDNATSQALGLTTAGSNNVASGSSTTRSTLQTNYNGLLTQISALVADSGYNGVNLLTGDNLKIDFNATGSSSLTIQGVNFDAQGLGLSSVSGTGGANSFQSDATLAAEVTNINNAISTVQSQTETFGTNSSTISTRQSFTNAMINTLQTGASNLVAADQNQESADLLTEQTQQQLEISALSIANQANQSVLKLFG
jgi:flagellin